MSRMEAEEGGISFEYGGPMGKLVENNMLGGIRKTEETEYQKFDDSIEFVKKNQIGEPSDPSAWFANDLHATIANEIGLEDYSQLKFYTAVGSPLDKYHSIDGFFELQLDPKNNPNDVARVTVDLTTNPNKDKYRADLVILVPHDGLDPKDEDYKEALQKHADEITAKLMPYLNKKETVAA